MNKKKQIVVLTIGYGIFFIVLIGICAVYFETKEQKFTPNRWKASTDSKRYKFIKSFEKQYEVIGMKREEIETLLGNPNKTETKKGTKEIEAYEYRIEDNLIAGWKVYRINFKKDIVTKVEILTEDW